MQVLRAVLLKVSQTLRTHYSVKGLIITLRYVIRPATNRSDGVLYRDLWGLRSTKKIWIERPSRPAAAVLEFKVIRFIDSCYRQHLGCGYRALCCVCLSHAAWQMQTIVGKTAPHGTDKPVHRSFALLLHSESSGVRVFHWHKSIFQIKCMQSFFEVHKSQLQASPNR